MPSCSWPTARPDRLDQVEAYYTDIRRGSPPPPHLLEELLDRYRAIGGGSPLSRIVEEQRAALEAELAARGHAGPRLRRDAAHRAAHRRHREGHGRGRRDALRRDRPRSPGLVERRRLPAGRGHGAGRCWATARPDGGVRRLLARPAAVHRGAGARRPARRSPASTDPTGVRVMFTAHSLPARVLADGDPYPAELAADRAARGGGAGPRHATSSASRAPAAPASRGWARTSSTRSGASPPRASRGWSSGRSASSRITWRSSTTSTSRRRAWPARPASAWSGRAR